jgi:CubicO group peptidase (beta-lactamase class C family)
MLDRLKETVLVLLLVGFDVVSHAGEGGGAGRLMVLPDSGPVLVRDLAQGKLADLAAAVDACVTADMAATDTPGAAAAVMVDGVLAYERGYGVRRRGSSNPVDADTVFRIGSVTKMMTAAALLQQVEAGRVSLDDLVTEYVPELELAGPWPPELITVRHLLSGPDLRLWAGRS